MRITRRFRAFATLEFSYWFAVAAADYMVVLFQQNGFSSVQIGSLNAVNSLVVIFSGPLWGMLADYWRSPRKAFVITMSAGAFLWMLLPLSMHIRLPFFAMGAPFILAAASVFFRTPANSLQDTFMVQKCVFEGVNYSGVRSVGSFSFASFAIVLSLALPYIGVPSSFYIFAVLSIPCVLLMARESDVQLPNSPMPKIQKGQLKEHFALLFKDYYFLSFIGFAFFLNLSTSVSLGFLPFLISEVGSDSSRYGLVSGFKAFIEVPALLMIGPLRKIFSLPVIIIIACFFYVAEYFFFAGAGGFVEIMIWSILQGLGGGLLIGTATNYVYALSPPELTSTAQTIYASVCSLAAIVANIAAGILINSRGVRFFYMVLCVETVVTILFLLATLLIGRCILKKPLPPLALKR
ncbi:MAG: MFS transporter [Spirochaetaceae bacterium]|jgi:PPP family 3-phenylpropionic acid transporter|nr:MFS transporter [Spirochaetaceae bacterium]